WIDEIAKRFEKADEQQRRKLSALFTLALGEEPSVMGDFVITLKDGTEISVSNLNADNIPIFASVIKSLIAGDYNALEGLKDQISEKAFNEYLAGYNSQTLITERFAKLHGQAVAELLQYEYFEYVGKARSMGKRTFRGDVYNWAKTRRTEFGEKLPGRMVDVHIKGIDEEFFDEPLSEAELEEQHKKWSETFDTVMKESLKKTAKIKDLPVGRVVSTAVAGAAVGAGVGTAVGAVVGSIVPVVGTAVGASVGASIGAVGGALLGGIARWYLDKKQKYFGWSDMKKKYKVRGAAAKAVGTVAKEGIEGATDGALVGAAVGAIVGGIVGFIFGGIGVIPGILGGLKIGASGGGIVMGTGKMIGAVSRIRNPGISRVATEKQETAAGLGEIRMRREFEGPPGKTIPHVREMQQDEFAKMMDESLARDEDGVPSSIVRDLVLGARKETAKVESRSELRKRITLREVTLEDGRKVTVLEVAPQKDKNGKPIREGVLTSQEQMEAHRMYMENVRAQSTIVLPDGSTPSPPDFICVPFMGLARQTIDRSEEEGNEQQALKVLLADILDQGEAFRQEGIPLNVFVKGLSKTDDEKGYKFSDVVPLDNRRIAAIVKGYQVTGATVDLTIPDGQDAAIRSHNGKMLLLVRSDNGQVVVRDFGQRLGPESADTMRAITALTALKNKGRQAILDYDTPEAAADREEQKKKMGAMASMLGKTFGDTDIELALRDPIVRDMLENSNIDSDDIYITSQGISVKTPGAPEEQKRDLILFEGETARIAPGAKIDKPLEIIALPRVGLLQYLYGKVAQRTGSLKMRLRNAFQRSKLMVALNESERLKRYPRILKTFNWLGVTAPASIFSGDVFALMFNIFVFGIPEVMKTKLIPLMNEKVAQYLDKFNKIIG
ncbi:MAG: hypothetical protein WBD00_00990, partial [Candidatus Omnitrophota bacterium]